jgi:hypothetical protein
VYATFIVDGNAPIWNQQFLGPSADTQDAFILRKSCLNNVCGKCIDLAGGDITNGNKIQLWDCNGKDSQLWVYDGLYIRYKGNNQKCIDTGSVSKASKLQIWCVRFLSF